jgi:hypothetical protein
MSEITGREHWERGLDGDRKQPRLVIDTCHPASNFASIAWSGDGLILAGALNGTVKLWSRSNQTRLLTLRPLMLPALFDDTEEWRDTLGISRILNDVLREQSARGRKASLVFVDTREHPRAYSLKGRYTLSGNAVVVESRVFWATEEVDRFSLTGRVDDLENFARNLVERTIESVRNHWSQKSSNPLTARVADMNA